MWSSKKKKTGQINLAKIRMRTYRRRDKNNGTNTQRHRHTNTELRDPPALQIVRHFNTQKQNGLLLLLRGIDDLGLSRRPVLFARG